MSNSETSAARCPSEHLDELRKRLIRAIIFVFIAFVACWFVSDHIYNFLARPVRTAC
ncbi:MAG: twin-arginine translocase subunit TatC [Pyrinomonadaceae bacterium]